MTLSELEQAAKLGFFIGSMLLDVFFFYAIYILLSERRS